MQPPLPEVPKVSAPSNAKPAFFGLNVVTGVETISLIISCFLYLVFLKPEPVIPTWVMQIFYALWFAVYAAIVYFLWRGYNWARWAMVVCSVLSVMTLISPTSASQFPEFERIYSNISIVWAIGVGIWLLLPGVARHFKEPKPV